MNLEELQKQVSNGQEFEYLFFYGHQPSEDGRITKSCFSQWFYSPFVIDKIVYPTAEHWMMASKARLFNDDKILSRILNSSEPKAVKNLGRKVKDFKLDVWSDHCRALVTEGNIAKFEQNEKLKTFLLSTGNSVIVEASPSDTIWGIGLKFDDERAKNPMTWLGQNLLGFSLMDVRYYLSRN